MHIGPRRRQHFRHLHPAVLGKLRGHNLVRVVDVPARRQLHRLRHLHDQVRPRDAPAFRPASLCRPVIRLARRLFSRSPLPKRRNLFAAQRRIVAEPPNSRHRKPRRHRLVLRREANSISVSPRLVVTLERHRSDTSRPMASLAMLLQNRQHIPIKSGSSATPHALRSDAVHSHTVGRGGIRSRILPRIDRRTGNCCKAPNRDF